MELKYPKSHCGENPKGSHYYSVIVGDIWICRYCWAVKWLPAAMADHSKFRTATLRLGLEKAYQKAIGRRPKVKETLIKLEELRLVRKEMTKGKLKKALAAIIANSGIGKAKYEQADENFTNSLYTTRYIG